MPKRKTAPEIDPVSLLNLAREFYTAADSIKAELDFLSKPLYFLRFHALELAFKAFLRSHNVPTMELMQKDKGHKLTTLYGQCRQRGLVIGPEDQTDIGNIVALLEEANEYQGLRYFNPGIKALPRLDWTRETTHKLIRTVELKLGVGSETAPGPAKKLIFVLGKPTTNS